MATETNVLERAVTIKVPVENLHPNNWNPNRQAEFDFELLKRSMLTDGFTTPVLVRPHPDSDEPGIYQILDGYHRYKAWSEMGNTEIDVIVLNVSDAQARLITMQMNNRGTEKADMVADLLRELAEAGHVELLRDELMMDDVEMKRMLESIKTESEELAKIQVSSEMLGPSGAGLGSLDASQGIDLTADEKRAKQRVLANMKAQEEDAMEAKDKETFRIVLVFSDQEAEVVKAVLDVLGKEAGTGGQAAAVLELCRRATEAA